MKRGIRKILIPGLLLSIVIVIGIIGYMLIEDFPFIEAFYMTIITISTVGFGTAHKFSEGGMLFASGLIIVSFGLFAYTVSTFTNLVVEGVFNDYFTDRKLKKQIKKMEGHVIICGYGRNGKQAAAELFALGEKFIVIEKDDKVVTQIKENNNFTFVYGNAVHEEDLEKAGIKTASSLITTLPNDADNLFIVLSARELNPDLKIISRASEDHSDTKLRRAGANNVIMPDKIGGQRMAKLVAQADIVEFIEGVMLQDHDDVNLEEIDCQKLQSCVAGKSIGELGVRNKSGANIIGIKKGDGNYIYNPASDYFLQKDDKIFVIGSPEQIRVFVGLLSGN